MVNQRIDHVYEFSLNFFFFGWWYAITRMKKKMTMKIKKQKN